MAAAILTSNACFVVQPTKELEVVKTPKFKMKTMRSESVSKPTVSQRMVGSTEYMDDGKFEFEGLVGIAAMNKACESEYGPGALAATRNMGNNLYKSTKITSGAWIAPSPYTDVRPRDTKYVAYYSRAVNWQVGQEQSDKDLAMTAAYCASYQCNTTTCAGPYIVHESTENIAQIYYTITHRIHLGRCDEIRPVACSAPVKLIPD